MASVDFSRFAAGVVSGAGVAGVRVVRRWPGVGSSGGGFVGPTPEPPADASCTSSVCTHSRLPHQLAQRASAPGPAAARRWRRAGGRRWRTRGGCKRSWRRQTSSGPGGTAGRTPRRRCCGAGSRPPRAVVRPGADLLGDLAGRGGRAAAQFAAGHVQLGHAFRRSAWAPGRGRRHGRGRGHGAAAAAD